MSEKIKIICVAGPTASGKTGLGVRLAKALDGEVVSADSMQIYKDMHIASAAADESEMQGVKHHLLEFLPYGETFTVYDFLRLARECISDIASRGKVPVIVGGTGLYISSLTDNLELTETETDYELRARLEEEYDRLGGEMMLKKLSIIDSTAAKNLHSKDRRRIVRAFEIFETTGKTKTEQDRISRENAGLYDATVIGLNFDDREKLYERINKRVDIMVQNGLIEEAHKAFLKTESGVSGGAVQAIGHKEFFPYFKGEISLCEAVENLKRQTRRYAKRQLTWFRAKNYVNWVYPDMEDPYEKAKIILESKGYSFEEQ